ncbi:hypothetical protein PHYPSEUDO_002148 [Phytophthora pseudosyringae]|uniref:Rhodanese domain-containing protein n=1 Tax=Phytophthora pseudosyringae TaxID=221518 RepID=A0A8T1V2Z7_9STRA|nr:hypothetical protein PHYPSEUDO_002148 [Phytophthora pseudosyringae]
MWTAEELLAVERISPDDLAAVLRSDAEHPTIIDVRSEDYELEGHIVDAQHVPSASFTEDATIDALVARFGSKPELVFHCGHSVNRGPTCALRFIERAKAAGVKPHVRVLAGGFADFAEKFADAADLVAPPAQPSNKNE